MFGAIAGGALAGLLLGLLDVAILLARGIFDLGAAEALRLLAAGACAGVTAGAATSLPLGLVLLRWRSRPLAWRAAAAGAAAAVAVAGCLVDAFMYVNLYREAHLWVGALALVAAVLAGGLVFPARGAAAGALAAAALALAASWLGPGALGDGQRLWQPLRAQSTLSGRVAGLLWPEPAAPGAALGCRFREPSPVDPRGGAEGMNVLLVTVDALRGDLGGDRLPETMPEVSARLSDASVFTRAHTTAVQSTWSDTATLRGRWPHRIAFNSTLIDENDRFQPLPDDHPMVLDPRTWRQRPLLPVLDETPTLAEILAGEPRYRTLTVVPWVFFLPAGGITRGFETVDDAPYQERNRDNRGVTADLMTDRALALLGALDPGEPWLLWLHYVDPHEPYVPYGDVAADAPARDRYLAELRRVDHEVGRLLDGLAERGLSARTVVALWSDHGEEFRDHGGSYHGTSVYEEQAHVALLVRVPGVRGRRIDDVVSLVDVAPTVVDLLGVSTQAHFDGRSLAPLLRGELGALPEGPVLTFATQGGLKAAVIDGAMKLTEEIATGAVQLFDLAADPQERRNLADERPAEVARLRCILGLAGVPRGGRPR